MVLPDRKIRFWKLLTISLVESTRIVSEIHQLVGGSNAIARQLHPRGISERDVPNQPSLPFLARTPIELQSCPPNYFSSRLPYRCSRALLTRIWDPKWLLGSQG